TPSPSASPSAPTPAEIQQCTTAIAKASAAISQAAATIVQASKSAGTSSTSSHGSTGSSTSTTSTTSQAAAQASRVASAAVAVLQDQSAVSTAQANLADATLVAPVGGVVASIPFSVGDTATTSEAVIISAAGDADITVDVPISDMSLVKSGLAAQVTPDGAQTALTGSVATVSLLPVSSTASTPSYPAVVTVANPPIALATGSQAVVALTVASATNALRVPTSALSGLAGNTATAIVLSGSDSTSSVSVQVGAVGDGWAQIVSGLQIGQQVVLADNQATLPSNSSTSTGRFGSGGGFGGGSFTGGTRTGGTTGGSSSRTGG
ncbi:efflux RND transporter periplasmic adaptor subunit, partial [Microbacterium ginsengisoli]|uniref:efflux RND transporter periplasmic adaptor subunit n=1 Tax=Microbacterium ginsengisoli TaxID=400772 RepID=UPI000AF352E1